MRYLREDVYVGLVGRDIGLIPTAKDFAAYFDDLRVDDEDSLSRNLFPRGGQAMFLKLLRREITLEELLAK
jgi:hypothetical protein